MLWVWQQPSNLKWLKRDDIGIAYLAETIKMTRAGIIPKPRLHPLRITPGKYLEAVIRIESLRNTSPQLSEKQLQLILERVLLHANHGNIQAIQIDFDAKRSQRGFYRKLLARAKKELPGNVKLSMTCLASWCIADRWLNDLEVDQVVPMFFRMGADRRRVRAYLRSGGKVYGQGHELSFGFSMDQLELFNDLPRHYLARKRVYLFPAGVWSKDKLKSLVRLDAIREKLTDGI